MSGPPMRIERDRIPMPDGVHLAVTLYLPDGPEPPWPAILEYLPYRKDDQMLERDLGLYPYLAARGYAGARVDIRGTGSSEGTLPAGEYSDREQEDAEAVIAWLADRPWSNGSVGMWGISWGGFNAIQVALRRPPALKAIVAADASDDLFTDDIHYIDGMWHVDEYELMIDLLCAMTPPPDFPIDDAVLADRFDREPWLLSWLRHQRDGAYWRRASLKPGYERLRVPAFLVGGWYDGYRDSVARMLEHVPAPTRAIVGPWNHTFPHSAVPGPEIEWRRDLVRWWDHWLKGRDTGILSEPKLWAYLRGWHPPDPDLETIPGRWVGVGWPVRDAEQVPYHLDDGGLARSPGPATVHRIEYRATAGAEAGPWWGELAVDQRPLDEMSLVYDSEPLGEALEILGIPTATLTASADARLSRWFVRLSDVAPDGRVTMVTGGGYNREEPPGEVSSFEVPLRFTSWAFEKGHRIRIAVSNALWPMIWPSPNRMATSLHIGKSSRVLLPLLPPGDLPEPEFPGPERSPGPEDVGSRGEMLPVTWEVRRDGSRATARWRSTQEMWFPWGREELVEDLTYEADDEHPEDSSVVGKASTRVLLDGRTLEWRADLQIHSDREHFHYRYTRLLEEDGRTIRERTWEESVPRDGQ